METAHTPGPWYVATDMRGINNVAIVGVKDAHKQPVANCGISGYANARLIAAAPDLLNALDDIGAALANWSNSIDRKPQSERTSIETIIHYNAPEVLAIARGAIEKATGKE